MHGEAEDPRVSRTQAALREAFYNLLLKRRYDEIKISDIIERAQIGRSTFYEHFNSKDELLVWSLGGLLGILAETVELGSDPQRTRRMLDHFWQNRRLARATIAGPPKPQIVRALAARIEVRLTAHAGNAIVPMRLAALQLAEGALALINGWLMGEAPCSAAALATALRQSMAASVAALLAKMS